MVNRNQDLQWTLKRVLNGNALSLDYAVTNSTKQPIYVCDRMVVHDGSGYVTSEQAVILQTDPDTVIVAKGLLSPDAPVAQLTLPTFKKLAPGESIHETLQIPLPLKTWHPNGRVNPIMPPISQMRLSISTIHGEPTKWADLDNGRGGTLRVPDQFEEKWLDGGTQPIPVAQP